MHLLAFPKESVRVTAFLAGGTRPVLVALARSRDRMRDHPDGLLREASGTVLST